MKGASIFILITWFWTSGLVAQNLTAVDDPVDFQFWINYAVKVDITEKLSYGGDVGFRGFISNREWNQILVRPAINYKFNSIFGVSNAIANLTTINRDLTNTYEFRIHQDFTINWPDLTYVAFFSRLRVEERWFFYENLDNDFKVRIRILIGIESDDIRLGEGKRPFYFQAIWEGFNTLGEEAVEVLINNTRIHGAFGHRIAPNFRYELHYIAQRSRLYVEDGLSTTQNIFRIRFIHRM